MSASLMTPPAPIAPSTDENPSRRWSLAAVELAEDLLNAANQQQTKAEVAQARQMTGLISDSAAKALSMAMTDRLIRSSDAKRAARGWRAVLSRFGVPLGFGGMDRAMLRAGVLASWVFPGIVMAAVRRRLRHDSRGVILQAESIPLGDYLAARSAVGVRVNVNPLGEAILGEEEARHRLDAVLALLGRADIDYVSVKISAIFSQINLLAWEATLAEIKKRLRTLYRAAMPAGKFVNLDMEEYRDLALTVAAFRELLDEPEFHSLSAGIVLQAYLPDSAVAQRELTTWAKQRVDGGGARIKVRLVKGANLAMETVEAELHGWHAAPYSTKADSDANFRRMLEYACQPENAAAVRLGVGSHNLFDVALALVLREAHGVEDSVEIEMLEGMANHQARAVRDEAGALLVYAPVVREKDFGSALAYLMRRLDENTAPGNFLTDLFALAPGNSLWEAQKARFLTGWKDRSVIHSESNRETLPALPTKSFENSPDTDWTQLANRDAVWSAIASF